MSQHEKWVKFLREQYPAGTRLRLSEMKDPYSPVPPGTEGTVELVDDGCNIHMKWDNGRTLALIPGQDSFSIVHPKLVPLKLYMPLTINRYEKDEDGTLKDKPTELKNRAAFSYESEIIRMVTRHERQEEVEHGLMHWYQERNTVSNKVVSLRPTVEAVKGTLMGVVVCMVKGHLTPEEINDLKEYTSSPEPKRERLPPTSNQHSSRPKGSTWSV